MWCLLRQRNRAKEQNSKSRKDLLDLWQRRHCWNIPVNEAGTTARESSTTWGLSSVQLLSRVRLFANPTDCNTPGFPFHHQHLELAQIHVHWVDDAVQPSHPLSSPSPPVFNLSQHQESIQWVSSLHQVASGKLLGLSDVWKDNGLVGPDCQGDGKILANIYMSLIKSLLLFFTCIIPSNDFNNPVR